MTSMDTGNAVFVRDAIWILIRLSQSRHGVLMRCAMRCGGARRGAAAHDARGRLCLQHERFVIDIAGAAEEFDS